MNIFFIRAEIRDMRANRTARRTPIYLMEHRLEMACQRSNIKKEDTLYYRRKMAREIIGYSNAPDFFCPLVF